jgi:hypothetical protein
MLSEDITVRNPKLAWREAPARAWFGASFVLTHALNAFSTTFPAGERFFMDSVRRYFDRIRDPRLRARVKGFLGQEEMHSREHARFNELLAAQGYPVAAAERLVERVLGLVRRRCSARTQLAATCALEHFTTILSTAMLASPEVHAAMSGEQARLWTWHWVEELEHKEVAFEIFAATGGKYYGRALVMAATTLVLWAVVLAILARYLAHDRRLFSPREWGRGLAWAFLRPGILRRALPSYLAWYRPGYHPSHNPDTALLSEWRARLRER